MDGFDDFWDFFDDLILTANKPEIIDKDKEENSEICHRRNNYYSSYRKITSNNDLKWKRISVMGYSGSGKTYVSNIISEKYKIPIMHIEEIKYTKTWKSIEDSEIIPQIELFMSKDLWIIDGNYGNLRINERLEKSDLIILLLMPRLRCLFAERKKSKFLQNLGYKSYWCAEFVKYVLSGCRGKAQKRFYGGIAGKYSSKTVVLKSRRQIRRFIKRL